MESKSNLGWRAAGALVSLALVGVMLLRLSDAAFTATTSNAVNQWTSGDVELSDDDAGAAMFTMTDMTPGDTSTACITVTYAGSLDATARLYATVTAGTGLEDYVDLTVARGTGGSFGDCTGFVSSEAVYSGTLAGFATAHSAYASGAGTWSPTGGAPDDVMTYRFTTTLQDDNAAQGLTATATFAWEAQNV